MGVATVLAREASSEGAVAEPEWKGPLRTLLLSRSISRRRVALEQLQDVFEEVSSKIAGELAQHGKASMLWHRIILRPFVGYRSACASLHRTMVNYVLPEQLGSKVVVQRRDENGKQRVRYVLRDDAMEGAKNHAGDGDSEANDAGSDAIVDPANEARALSVLLRQLIASTAWELEAAASESSEMRSSSDGWLARTPDLETPKYEVVFEDPSGLFEIRTYKPYSVVQTGMGESGGGNRQFFTLANYIFGKANKEQQKMAMTTPVQTESKTGAMSFIMPSNYWDSDRLAAAPAPTEDAGVQLVSRPEETVAVTVFGGYARSAIVAKKREALLAALDSADNIEVPDPEASRLMQYNDPFTVPWKRRNEIAIPVRIT